MYQDEELVDSVYQEDDTCLRISYEDYPSVRFADQDVETIICVEGVFGTAIPSYQAGYPTTAQTPVLLLILS